MTIVGIIDSSPIFTEGLIRILERHDLRTTTSGRAWTGHPMPAEVLIVEESVWTAGPARRYPPHAGILLTVVHLDSGVAQRYLHSGVRGVIDRCAEAWIVVEAVRAVAAGGRFLGTAEPGCQCEPADTKPATSVLSHREEQVIQLIARGMTHGQIARRLGLSPHTVDTYVRRVRAKLDLGNKADLTRAALQSSG